MNLSGKFGDFGMYRQAMKCMRPGQFVNKCRLGAQVNFTEFAKTYAAPSNFIKPVAAHHSQN
jgi:hypothetical protein